MWCSTGDSSGITGLREQDRVVLNELLPPGKFHPSCASFFKIWTVGIIVHFHHKILKITKSNTHKVLQQSPSP